MPYEKKDKDLEIDVAVFSEKFLNHYEFLAQMNKDISGRLDELTKQFVELKTNLQCPVHVSKIEGIENRVKWLYVVIAGVVIKLINDLFHG